MVRDELSFQHKLTFMLPYLRKPDIESTPGSPYERGRQDLSEAREGVEDKNRGL